jgi:hypothetical protein
VYKPVPFKQCGDCHADPHKGRLSSSCSDCHVTKGFAIVDQREFNHALTRYPLKGKHVAVGCGDCHGPNLTKRTPAFSTCASCHSDPHRGEATLAGRPVDCASCHRVEGFTPSTFGVTEHRSARYSLEGKHATVKCAACHAAPRPGSGTRFRLGFAQCADCHADAHAGELANRSHGGACESCHVVAGWTPSTFGAATHATLRLPLEGKHATTSCGSCHATSRAGLPPLVRPAERKAAVTLALPETECAACHQDPHVGRAAEAGPWSVAGGCRGCHGGDAFRPSTVDRASHARFGFALEGAHAAVACIGCHEELKAPPSASSLLLAAKAPPLPFGARRTACGSCHESPHGGQFEARRDGGACDGCHGVSGFAPADRFAHDRDAAFKLEGAHARVPCASCHRSVATATGSSRVVYRPVSTACASCHAGRPSTEEP